MSYIATTPPEQAEGEVQAMYQRQQAHFGYLPNYARLFCHRPEVMKAWATLIATIRRPMESRRSVRKARPARSSTGGRRDALSQGRCAQP